MSLNTFFSIAHLIIAFFGCIFLTYTAYRLWILNKWRFYPKLRKERERIRKIEARNAALIRKEKVFIYQGKRIWATNYQYAVLKYKKLSPKDQKRLTEIF